MSPLNTRVVGSWDVFRQIFDTFRRNGVRYTINTDGPEMLRTYMGDELATLGHLGILSVEEQEQVVEWARSVVSRARGRGPLSIAHARRAHAHRARGGLAVLSRAATRAGRRRGSRAPCGTRRTVGNP